MNSSSEPLRGCTPSITEGPSQASVKQTEAYVINNIVGDLTQFCMLKMWFVVYRLHVSAPDGWSHVCACHLQIEATYLLTLYETHEELGHNSTKILIMS